MLKGIRKMQEMREAGNYGRHINVYVKGQSIVRKQKMLKEVKVVEKSNGRERSR